MQVSAHPVVRGGSALIASGLIAVTPVITPPDLHHRVLSAPVRLVDTDTSLVADLAGLSSLVDGLFANGSILNLPYNFIADIVNIPYEESLALQEYAYALGPAGTAGGVAGWIPPGATVADGGVDVVNGQDYYALGGTGSWWMESMGNTWGWDNGNWPQLDALIHFLLPFPWTEGITTSLQSVAQSSLIDGAAVNCEFECSDVLGYLGGWLTHFGNVFSSTYPTTLTDTIGANSSTGVINVGPAGTEDTAIWSGQQTINPLLEPLEAIWTNSTSSPADNPIMLPNIVDVFENLYTLYSNIFNDWFNAFQEGSFAYWGASTLYSIPSVIGGFVHDFSLGLIPNEFVLPNNGAEPLSGYTDGPSQLLPNLEQGFQFLATGLEKYFDPSTYLPAASTDPLGSLGDPSALVTDLSSLMPNLGTDLTSMLSSLIP